MQKIKTNFEAAEILMPLLSRKEKITICDFLVDNLVLVFEDPFTSVLEFYNFRMPWGAFVSSARLDVSFFGANQARLIEIAVSGSERVDIDDLPKISDFRDALVRSFLRYFESI